MALFKGFRRKPDEPEPQDVAAEPNGLEGEGGVLDESAASYRTMYMNIIPAGDEVLLHNPERAAPAVLPMFELDFLAECAQFASVEEHAAAAARRTGLPADGVAQRLYDLVDRGILVSKQEVVARARAATNTDSDSSPALDRVAVTTSDRPGSLANCLRSYRERYGSALELVVFDDSADAATRAENRRVAAQTTAGGRILYAGEEEKHRAVIALAERSGVDPDDVRAALTEFDGCTFHVGANRNAVLLDAAGGAVLMVDDDSTARAAQPPDKGEGLRLSSRYDPWSLHFFANVDDAIKAADWQDVDLIAWHRRFLGSSPAACAFGPAARSMPLPIDEGGVALDLNEVDAGLIAAFSRGRGRVVVTSAGVVGDSGMGLPLYFLSLQGPARERLLENYESYRMTRAVHRGADVATISNTQLFMAAHVAYDVRGTIPPFPPLLRNEDGAFAAILRTCAPECYVAFLPWWVEHISPDTRPADVAQLVSSVARVRANDIIRDLALAYEPGQGVTDPTVRLRAFGQYLAALGAMPTADFDALVRYQIVSMVGRRIERLARAVNLQSGQPVEWAEDCAMVMTEGMRALTEDELVVADIPGATADERYRRFQRLLHRFGRVIDAWPTLLEAASGLRVAEPLVL